MKTDKSCLLERTKKRQNLICFIHTQSSLHSFPEIKLQATTALKLDWLKSKNRNFVNRLKDKQRWSNIGIQNLFKERNRVKNSAHNNDKQ